MLLLFTVALPAAAQDQGLDPFLFANRDDTASATEVEARGFQLYRLPLSVRLRKLDDHPWGLRITFPVSLSSLKIQGVSDVGGFVEKLGIAAIMPGVEVEIPAGRLGLVRPFGEVGFGKGGDSDVETFYRAGVRAHASADAGKLHLTYGGMISGRRMPVFEGTADRYASFEGGIDVKIPLGFTINGGQARAGPYVIGRAFSGLVLDREDLPQIELHGQVETGVSFSTEPVLRIWKFPLRWLAVGYQFGQVSAVRMYLMFPF